MSATEATMVPLGVCQLSPTSPVSYPQTALEKNNDLSAQLTNYPGSVLEGPYGKVPTLRAPPLGRYYHDTLQNHDTPTQASPVSNPPSGDTTSKKLTMYDPHLRTCLQNAKIDGALSASISTSPVATTDKQQSPSNGSLLHGKNPNSSDSRRSSQAKNARSPSMNASYPIGEQRDSSLPTSGRKSRSHSTKENTLPSRPSLANSTRSPPLNAHPPGEQQKASPHHSPIMSPKSDSGAQFRLTQFSNCLRNNPRQRSRSADGTVLPNRDPNSSASPDSRRPSQETNVRTNWSTLQSRYPDSLASLRGENDNPLSPSNSFSPVAMSDGRLLLRKCPVSPVNLASPDSCGSYNLDGTTIGVRSRDLTKQKNRKSAPVTEEDIKNAQLLYEGKTVPLVKYVTVTVTVQTQPTSIHDSLDSSHHFNLSHSVQFIETDESESTQISLPYYLFSLVILALL